MTLAEKRSRKAIGSSGISCGGLKDTQAEGCPLDIKACNKLQLFLCRWNRDRGERLQKIDVIAVTNRNTPFIESIRLQQRRS